MRDDTNQHDGPGSVLGDSLVNIAEAVAIHRDLLRGARQLRLMTAQPRAQTALTALLRVRAMEQIRLSWNLLGSIAVGGRSAVAGAFLKLVGSRELALFTWALLGLSPTDALAGSAPVNP